MPAGEGRYYYSANGGTIGDREVTGLRIEEKGTTMDGYQVHHFTYHRNDTHISYDTVRINKEYHYIPGSGHEVSTSGNKHSWDPGRAITWQDAIKRNSYDLVASLRR